MLQGRAGIPAPPAELQLLLEDAETRMLDLQDETTVASNPIPPGACSQDQALWSRGGREGGRGTKHCGAAHRLTARSPCMHGPLCRHKLQCQPACPPVPLCPAVTQRALL